MPEARATGPITPMAECRGYELDHKWWVPDAEAVAREKSIDKEIVIEAIGNGPNPLIPKTTPGLTTSRHGTLVVDEATMMTTRKGDIEPVINPEANVARVMKIGAFAEA